MAFDVAARSPWPVLALVLLASLGAVEGVGRIDAQVDFVDTVPPHEGLEPYRVLLERLDGVRFAAVYMAHDNASGTASLRADEGFDALVHEQRNLTAFLEARFPAGTFSHSLSAYEGMRAGNYMLHKMATAGNAPPESYALPADRFTWDLVRNQTRDAGSLDDVLAQDGSSALLLMFLSTKDNLEARQLAGEVDAAIVEWAAREADHPVTQDHAVSGLLFASHYADGINRAETLRWAPLAAAGVAVALLFAVRRVSNVLIATSSLGVALLWTFGLMGWFGVPISFLTVFLAPVVVGVGVDYAIHLLHRYEEERDAGRERRDAAAEALRTTGGAITLAALTTAAGLATLLVVPAPLFAQIGGVGALGILMGLLAAVTLVPALRAVLPDMRCPSRRDLTGRVLAAWARGAGRLAPLSVLVVLLLAGAAAHTAMTRTVIESGSSENEFPQDDPVIRLQQRIEREYGTFQRAYLVVQGDLTQPQALRALYDAGISTSDVPLHRGAASVVDLLIADDKTDEGALDIGRSALLGAGGRTPEDSQRLPQSQQEARASLDALFEDPLWRTLAPFTITRDHTLAVVAITLEPWQDQEELVGVRDALLHEAEALRDALGPEYEVAAAGAPLNRAAIIEQTPHDVRTATLGATAVVTGMLALAWARRGWGGIGMAALAGSVVLLASLVLLASIPLLDAYYAHAHASWDRPANTAALNNMFLLAFAVTVAVGVDDVVLLAHRYWHALDAGASRSRARDMAFGQAGRAITATSVTTFTAFALLTGVYFLQSKNLAILAAVGVASAYLLTMLLLPVVLRARNRKK